MIGTVNCVYETPCGWCSKWDKKCDKKTLEQEKETKYNFIYDTTTNKICQSESDHEWECTGISTAETTYMCKKCRVRKTVPYKSAVEDIPTWLSGKSNRL